MWRDTIRSWYRGLDGWGRLALWVWAMMLLAICGRAFVWPRIHSVYPIFANAARTWLAGADLYGVSASGRQLDPYRYSPLVAVLLLPFSALPDRVGGVLWRLLNAAVFLGGMAWWSRAVVPLPLAQTQRAALFLLVVPFSIGSLNNGQSNPLLIGLLLIATAGVAGGRWTLASTCLGLACLFKVYPIALGLLLAVLYPRKLAGRLAGVLALGLTLPFLFQETHYVIRQYVSWLLSVWAEDRRNWPLAVSYRDLWLLFRVWHVPIGPAGYLALQVLAALGVAAGCLAGRFRGWPVRQLLTGALALGTGWMMVFGPVTESSTYILFAPALAWAVMEAWLAPRPRWIVGVLLVSLGLFTVSSLAGAFPGTSHFHALGLQPLAALLTVVCEVEAQLSGVRRIGPTQVPAAHPLSARMA